MSEIRVARRNSRRKWYLALGAFATVFVFAFLVARHFNDNTNAANMGAFDPGYIMSDWQMGNYTSMNESQIQEFLKSKNSCYDTNTGKYTTGNKVNYFSEMSPPRTWHVKDGHFVCMADEVFDGGTAAHIIWQAAQDYRINPQVLLVLLEKEQSLVTDTFPHSQQYRSATGYGCPDTAPCSSQYYGLKNQIRKAAELFRTVLNGGWTNYPLGWNYVQYNPNTGCGGTMVNIRSLATSALYRYTPYQPNAAALGGWNDGCGAYGNMNFYKLFEDWFGGIKNDYSEKYGRTIPDGKYQITSKKYNSKSFDIYGGIVSNMSSESVILYGAKTRGADNQTFDVVFDDVSGYYKIYNSASGLYLDANNGELKVNKKNDNCGQKWNIGRREKVGYYTIVSSCDGKSLNALSENTIGLGNNTQAETNTWKLFEVSPESHALENGTYQISTFLNNDMVVDIIGGVKRDMVKGEVDLWKKKQPTSAIANQLFDVKYDSESGFYMLSNHLSGLLLDVYNNGTADGTKVIMWRDNDGCNQRWMIKKLGNAYEIISSCTGKALDVPKGNAVNGQGLIIYNRQGSNNQKWTFDVAREETLDLGEGEYVVSISENSDMVLDVNGGVSKSMRFGEMILYGRKASNNVNQIFKFKKTENNSEYYIYNPESNLYLDVYNGGVADGTRVILWQYNGDCNQRWRVSRTDEGFYQIVSACSDRVLDVNGGNINSLAPIIIYKNHYGSNQEWLFRKVNY